MQRRPSQPGPTSALVVFSDEEQRSAASAPTWCRPSWTRARRVVDAIRADGSRWWRVLDPDPVGHDYDTQVHPFTAEQVFEGRAALESRDELVRSLVGTDPAETLRVSRAADLAVDRFLPAVRARPRTAGRRQARWLHKRLTAAMADGELLPASDAGRVLALIAIHDLRDVAWGGMTRETAEAHVGFWRDLVRRSPPDLVPGAAAVLGFAAWLSGEGALAWCAVERCFERDPDDALARNVAALLQNAVPRRSWTPMPPSDIRRSPAGRSVPHDPALAPPTLRSMPATRITERHVEVGGHTLRVRDAGDPEGRPLVYFHGTPSCRLEPGVRGPPGGRAGCPAGLRSTDPGYGESPPVPFSLGIGRARHRCGGRPARHRAVRDPRAVRRWAVLAGVRRSCSATG